LQQANEICSLPFGFQQCLHNGCRRGYKWLDAECLQRAGDTQQATELQKQHEQVQQQIQAAEQQLEAAFTGKAESEQQLLSAQQGLDRYTTTLSMSVGIMLRFAVLSCAKCAVLRYNVCCAAWRVVVQRRFQLAKDHFRILYWFCSISCRLVAASAGLKPLWQVCQVQMLNSQLTQQAQEACFTRWTRR